MKTKLILLLLVTVLIISGFKIAETSASPTSMAMLELETGFNEQLGACSAQTTYALQKFEIEISPEISSTAEQISMNGKTKLEKVELLYNYVSDFEYKLFDNWRNANEILESNAGDCADQAICLVSMLRSIGIDAYVVSSGEHAWAAANIDNRWVQVDTTAGAFWEVQECLAGENCEPYEQVQEMFNENEFLNC